MLPVPVVRYVNSFKPLRSRQHVGRWIRLKLSLMCRWGVVSSSCMRFGSGIRSAWMHASTQLHQQREGAHKDANHLVGLPAGRILDECDLKRHHKYIYIYIYIYTNIYLYITIGLTNTALARHQQKQDASLFYQAVGFSTHSHRRRRNIICRVVSLCSFRVGRVVAVGLDQRLVTSPWFYCFLLVGRGASDVATLRMSAFDPVALIAKAGYAGLSEASWAAGWFPLCWNSHMSACRTGDVPLFEQFRFSIQAHVAVPILAAYLFGPRSLSICRWRFERSFDPPFGDLSLIRYELYRKEFKSINISENLEPIL